MNSLDLTMVNNMLREVYVNDILPNKVKKGHLRGCTSEAAMTITTAKRSGVKRDVSDVVSCNCKQKGYSADSAQLTNLSMGTPQ